MEATMCMIILLITTPLMIQARRVNMTVYYESMCPFSRRFLVNQLQDAFLVIENMVNLELVPFGFADFTEKGDSWDFRCQHGLEECFGNKLHACALELNSLRNSVEFIGCMEGAKDPIGSAEQCAKRNNMDWNKINNCANSELGAKLLHDNGIKTKSVKDLYGVPFIVINEVHSAVYEHKARKNLLALVCSLYEGPKGVKASECRESANSRSVRSARRNLPERIELGVFYETLCPYCKDFLLNQLHPSFVAVPEIFVTDLVPFGHANFTPDAGSWTFQCQHGPQECVGNKIQSCVLRFYPDNNVSIPFVHCMESGSDPVADAEQCAEDNGLDWTLIHQCSITELGSRLLHDNGIKTQNQTDLAGVPWILINGVHTDEDQSKAQLNLKGLLCDLYEGPKPPACSKDRPQVELN